MYSNHYPRICHFPLFFLKSVLMSSLLLYVPIIAACLFPLPIVSALLRRVCLAGRQENASRQASPCMFVVAQPSDASRIMDGNKRPPAFPNADG